MCVVCVVVVVCVSFAFVCVLCVSPDLVMFVYCVVVLFGCCAMCYVRVLCAGCVLVFFLCDDWRCSYWFVLFIVMFTCV